MNRRRKVPGSWQLTNSIDAIQWIDNNSDCLKSTSPESLVIVVWHITDTHYKYLSSALLKHWWTSTLWPALIQQRRPITAARFVSPAAEDKSSTNIRVRGLLIVVRTAVVVECCDRQLQIGRDQVWLIECFSTTIIWSSKNSPISSQTRAIKFERFFAIVFCALSATFLHSEISGVRANTPHTSAW